MAAARARGALHRHPERRLAQRLTDHALGRGARLTQVQVERGGFWVLAQTQPGGRTLERRLKQHGAARRCEVCKAVSGYQAGELAAEDALGRAGWDRSNPVQRSMLLDIFGLPEPPPALAAPLPPPGPRRSRWPGTPSSRPRARRVSRNRGRGASLPRPIPCWRPRWPSWSASWRAPELTARPPPEPVLEAGCEPARTRPPNPTRTGGTLR